jgi:hypothetical protein
MKHVAIFLTLILLIGGLALADGAPALSTGLGLGVSLPLFTSPTVTTGITFIKLYAEAPLTQEILARLDLGFYLSSTLLRLDLTSTTGELLLFLNPGAARFYIGGGLGTFPYENSAIVPGAPGFLLELNEVIGFRVLTQLFSIFAELKYAQMPQPLADGVGTVSSLQLTIGALINLGGAICCPPCPCPEESS